MEQGRIIDLFADEPLAKRTSKPVKGKGWSGLIAPLLPLLMIPKKILIFIVTFFIIGFVHTAFFIITNFWQYAIIIFLLILIYAKRKNILEWVKKIKFKK